MARCGEWAIGVCSWSLQTDLDGVVGTMEQLQIDNVHLDLRPVCIDKSEKYLEQVRRQGWVISSTMIGFPQEDYSSLDAIKVSGGIAPDDCWESNRRIFESAIAVTAELNVPYLSTHIGFIDETQPEYSRKFHDRIKLMADVAAQQKVILLLETGQETAEELRGFLEEMDHPSVAVNFDPANMILYDKGDPVDAVKVLGPWIKHVHIKDALRTDTPGTWGAEVAWGDGQVDTDGFLGALKEIGFAGTIAVEREAGDDRLNDIRQAVERLVGFQG